MEDKSPANEYNSITYQYWKNQIDAALKWRDSFDKKGEKIIARYRDEDRYDSDRRYNILYSNTETLQPVVYSSKPRADVQAQDSKSIANRKGAEVIELAIDYCIDNTDFDGKARTAITDFLLAGMGQMRPKYQAITGKEEIPYNGEATTDEVVTRDGFQYRIEEKVVFEKVDYEYVHWKDFIFPESATWEEVPWVAFRTKMTYEEAEASFGEKADTLVYSEYYTDNKKKKESAIKKAEIYEIWDKVNGDQIFFADCYNSAPIEINEDPLGLDGFFPVPKPLFSITTSGTLLPVPFYAMYEDQARELNEINDRMFAMISNMKRRGFYDASITEMANLPSMGDNTFYPVKDWQNFATKGGMAGAMQLEDITGYANILQILQQSRAQLLEDIYQIIGISDIRRGQTDPRETLGAQKMKGRYGTIRISTYQRKVAEFMRDLLRLTGEIIIKQFSPETIAMITNKSLETIKDSEDSTKIVEVGVSDLIEDLRSKEPINIKVDIETDSTIIEDQEEDRLAMTEAIAALTEFSNIAGGLMGTIGQEATAKILLSIVQKFKLGRGIQQDVTDYIEKIRKEGLPEQKSEAEVIAEAEVKKKEMDTNIQMAKIQADQTVEVAKLQLARETLMIESQLKAGDLQVKQQANLLKAEELGIYTEIERQKLDLSALDKMITVEQLKIEKQNPNDNAVVGV